MSFTYNVHMVSPCGCNQMRKTSCIINVLLVNEWLLFKAKRTIFSDISWREQATFRWCDDNYNYNYDDDQLLVGFLYC
jgi:hypothetical protein